MQKKAAVKKTLVMDWSYAQSWSKKEMKRSIALSLWI
ncbi:hypothetical protein predicted by Glimmer/Critica [Salmonella enterica subsp. enterica serovar Weltevreden str. 2007-60-3289-1]|nr:hypothetical protein predicted by Glimmer/Critica [Salmonella enterica subsp. enterica serovar Weltevreden str. 2007-60-3289-1]